MSARSTAPFGGVGDDRPLLDRLGDAEQHPEGPLGDHQRAADHRAAVVRGALHPAGHRPGVPPPTLVGALFSIVPVGGQATLTNLPILLSDQTLNPPIVDLARSGADPETGTTVIVLDVSLRFFGRTLSGDNIVSAPATFTIEVRP